MRVKVTDARYLPDLILFLRELGCVAEQAGADEADVSIPDSRNELALRLELSVYLDAWCIRDETASAKIVE